MARRATAAATATVEVYRRRLPHTDEGNISGQGSGQGLPLESNALELEDARSLLAELDSSEQRAIASNSCSPMAGGLSRRAVKPYSDSHDTRQLLLLIRVRVSLSCDWSVNPETQFSISRGICLLESS